MLFHMEYADRLFGWVLPDNPKALPRIKIYRPGSTMLEFEANVLRTDLRDRGLHDTGMVGFQIDNKMLPGLSDSIDDVEVRESDSNILIFRRFRPDYHLAQKVFRFELQAMPDSRTEKIFSRHFALCYDAVHRFPQDTFFGVANNPTAQSLYLCGRASFQQHESFLRERNFKTIALIRDPYEEMAERLLFSRYASSPDAPPFLNDYIFGLEPLKDMTKDIRFDDIDSLKAAFAAMTDEQKEALSNPLVRGLACSPGEKPRSGHVEIALSKLSRMDLVGLRSRFAEFKSILPEVIGVDIFGDHELTALSWVSRIVASLAEIRQVRTLLALDLDVYSFTEEAITEALGAPQSA